MNCRLDSTALLIPPEPYEKGVRITFCEEQDCALYAKAISWHDLISFIHLRGFKAVPLLLPGRIPSPQLGFQCPEKVYDGKILISFGKSDFSSV